MEWLAYCLAVFRFHGCRQKPSQSRIRKKPIRTVHGVEPRQSGHPASESASDAPGLKLVEATTQITALPQQSQPLVVPAPAPGERVEIDLTPDMALRFAFDLRGAQVAVADGKILVTLPNGAVIVLSGELVAQFLSGTDASLQDVLSSAAGRGDAPEVPEDRKSVV